MRGALLTLWGIAALRSGAPRSVAKGHVYELRYSHSLPISSLRYMYTSETETKSAVLEQIIRRNETIATACSAAGPSPGTTMVFSRTYACDGI